MMQVQVVKLDRVYFDKILEIESDYVYKLDMDQLNKILDNDSHEIFILKINDEVIGYIESSTIVPESEIYSIVIASGFQGNGYGSYLLNWFINYLKERKCKTIFLEVNKLNIKAINLYKKFGFTVYGERKNYYGDNDAILLRCDI